MLPTSTMVYNKCSSKIPNKPRGLEIILPDSHGIRRLIKMHIQTLYYSYPKQRDCFVLCNSVYPREKANEQSFPQLPAHCHYPRRISNLKTCRSYCHTAMKINA